MKRLFPILLTLTLALSGHAASTTIPSLTSHSPVVASNLFLVETGASTNGAYKLTFSNLQIGVLTSVVAGANITLARTNNVLTISSSGGGAGSLPTNNPVHLHYDSGQLSITNGAQLTYPRLLSASGPITNFGGDFKMHGTLQRLAWFDGTVTQMYFTASSTLGYLFGSNLAAPTFYLPWDTGAVLPGVDGAPLGTNSYSGNPYRWKGDFTNSSGHFTTLIGNAVKVGNSLTMAADAPIQMSNSPLFFGANAPLNGGYIQNANAALGGGNTNALAIVAGDAGVAVLVLSNATFAPAYGVGDAIWLGTNSAPWAGLALDTSKLAGTGPYLGLSNNTVIKTNADSYALQANLTIVSNALATTNNYILSNAGWGFSNTFMGGMNFTNGTETNLAVVTVRMPIAGRAGVSNFLARFYVADAVGFDQTDFIIQTNGVAGFRGTSSGTSAQRGAIGILNSSGGSMVAYPTFGGLRTGLAFNVDDNVIYGGAAIKGWIGNNTIATFQRVGVEPTNFTTTIVGATANQLVIERNTTASMRIGNGLGNAAISNGMGITLKDVAGWVRGTSSYTNATTPLPTFTNELVFFNVITNGDTGFGFTTGRSNQMILTGDYTNVGGTNIFIVYTNGIRAAIPVMTLP